MLIVKGGSREVEPLSYFLFQKIELYLCILLLRCWYLLPVWAASFPELLEVVNSLFWWGVSGTLSNGCSVQGMRLPGRSRIKGLLYLGGCSEWGTLLCVLDPSRAARELPARAGIQSCCLGTSVKLSTTWEKSLEKSSLFTASVA